MSETVAHARGRRVERRRKELCLSQEGLARLLGCSVRTVQRIEWGQNEGISQRMFEAIHEHLRIPIDELVRWKKPARKG